MTDETRTPEEILALFAEGAALLQEAVAGLTEVQLDLALDGESWSIRQIVHHVVDGDDLWKTFIKVALGNSEGSFDLRWYWDLPQDTWAQRWKYAERPIEPSLARFVANRQHVVRLIEATQDAWGLSAWVRTPEGRRQVPLSWVVTTQADHVVAHIEDVRRILEEKGS
jgi:hypothetical protein